MKITIVITVFLLFITKIISFAQFSDEFQKIIETENCRTLLDSIKYNWKFNKKKNYYQSNLLFKSPDTLVLKQVNLPCIKGIKKDDIQILFGKPHKRGSRTARWPAARNARQAVSGTNGFADGNKG